MPTLILDPSTERRLSDIRTSAGLSQRDEVWEGVTVITPLPNNEHQRLVRFFLKVLDRVYEDDESITCLPGANVSDRISGWESNYREPDLLVVHAGGRAKDCGTHWFGGPDFVLEIVSPEDQSRDKLPFYTSIGTKEVLILDRDPWQLELYQLRRNRLRLVGQATPNDEPLQLTSVPLQIGLVRSRPRPKLFLTHADTGKFWTF